MTKTNMQKTWLFLCAIAVSFNVFSLSMDIASPRNVAQQVSAVKWHSIIDDMAWRYTIETHLDTGSGHIQQRIQRFRPDAISSEQWQLLEQQYEAPPVKTLYEYRQTMSSLADEPDQVKGNRIVNLDSLQYLDSTSKYIRYSFSPELPMFETADENSFSGQLHIDTQSGELSHLTISLAEPISPSFSTKLTHYEMRLEFTYKEGTAHVAKLESHKRGKLLFVSEFDEKSTRIISDITPVDK